MGTSSRWTMPAPSTRRRYFYAKLALGTPARNFSLIIDTGSTITYVPCADCKHCGKHAVRKAPHHVCSAARRPGCARRHASWNNKKHTCPCGWDGELREPLRTARGLPGVVGGRPLTGCSHTRLRPPSQDPPFDPTKSSTAQVLPCGHAKCQCGSPPCSCNTDKCSYIRTYGGCRPWMLPCSGPRAHTLQGWYPAHLSPACWWWPRHPAGEPSRPAPACRPPLTQLPLLPRHASPAERSSSEGWLVLDKFSFPDASAPVDVTFGCATRETGEIFRQEADGILGMGNNNNAMHSQVGQRLHSRTHWGRRRAASVAAPQRGCVCIS